MAVGARGALATSVDNGNGPFGLASNHGIMPGSGAMGGVFGVPPGMQPGFVPSVAPQGPVNPNEPRLSGTELSGISVPEMQPTPTMMAQEPQPNPMATGARGALATSIDNGNGQYGLASNHGIMPGSGAMGGESGQAPWQSMVQKPQAPQPNPMATGARGALATSVANGNGPYGLASNHGIMPGSGAAGGEFGKSPWQSMAQEAAPQPSNPMAFGPRGALATSVENGNGPYGLSSNYGIFPGSGAMGGEFGKGPWQSMVQQGLQAKPSAPTGVFDAVGRTNPNENYPSGLNSGLSPQEDLGSGQADRSWLDKPLGGPGNSTGKGALAVAGAAALAMYLRNRDRKKGKRKVSEILAGR